MFGCVCVFMCVCVSGCMHFVRATCVLNGDYILQSVDTRICVA